MKLSKFKLAFIVLCVATIVLGTAFYYTRLEYAHTRPSEPYWEWRRGLYVIVTGEFLILAWGVFFGKLFTRKVYPRLKGLKGKKKITVLEMSKKKTQIVAALLILLGFVLIYVGVTISAFGYLSACGLWILLGLIYWEKRRAEKPAVNPLEARSPPSPN